MQHGRGRAGNAQEMVIGPVAGYVGFESMLREPQGAGRDPLPPLIFCIIYASLLEAVWKEW